MKGLVPGTLDRLTPTQTDLLTHVEWSSSGPAAERKRRRPFRPALAA